MEHFEASFGGWCVYMCSVSPKIGEGEHSTPFLRYVPGINSFKVLNPPPAPPPPLLFNPGGNTDVCAVGCLCMCGLCVCVQTGDRLFGWAPFPFLFGCMCAN